MTKEIQAAICKMLVLSNCPAVCENIAPLFHWEYDVAALSKSGMLSEYEVKISRSDFLADAKKGKARHYDNKQSCIVHAPNYMFYVTPTRLVAKEEIPIYAGLYYYEDGKLRLIKSPKRIHGARHKVEEIKNKMLRLISQRQYLGCALLTYKNKEAQRNYDEWLANQPEHIQQYHKNLKK